MDKVASSYYLVPTGFSQSMAPSIRGHHSSISKAVNAHRQMVEERSSRHAVRQLDNSAPAVSFSDQGVQMSPSQNNNVQEAEAEYYERDVIDTTSGPSKQAIVQSFQSTEPDRPSLGEPIPKGSYLDVEA